jgi:predicted negative regulator of RcsB-dependent stress response
MGWGRTAIGLLVLGLVGWTTWHGYEVTKCQADFNVAFAQALKDRAQAADDQINAQREYLGVVGDAHATVDQKTAAFHRYVKSLDEAALTRNLHPLPADPRCT